MKKFILSVAALGSTMAYSQIGVNNSNPKATMDITAKTTDGTKPEGLIAPRLTGDQIRSANAQYTAAQTGAIVYATSADSAPGGATANITAAGYYYFDGNVWQKVNTGTGGSAGDTTNDAWINDSANSKIKLATLSNGSTVRTTTNDIVIMDNGNMGVGTTVDPFAKLMVAGNGDLQGLLVTNNTSSSSATTRTRIGLGAGNPTWGGINYFNTNNTGGRVSLGTYEGLEYLTYNTTGTNVGNIGINNSSPDASAQLDVSATNKGFLPPRVTLTNATTAAPITLPATGLTVYHTGNAALPAGLYTNVGTPAAPNWLAGSGSQDTTNDAWVNDSANSIVKLGTLSNGSTARSSGADVVANDNGFLGLGNSTPTSRITITGDGGTNDDIKINSTAAAGGGTGTILFLRSRGTSAVGNNDVLGSLHFRGYDGASEITSAAISATTNSVSSTGNVPTDLLFSTGSATYTERMRITSGGNVGIGTTSPNASAILDVASTNKGFLPPRIALSSATDASTIPTPATGLTVYHTGNAGLTAGLYTNTGTPAAPNWVAGTATQDTTNDAWVNNSASSRVELGTLSNGSTARPTGTEFVALDNGNVGIGTSNPTSGLEVSSGTIPQIKLNNTSLGSWAAFRMENSNAALTGFSDRLNFTMLTTSTNPEWRMTAHGKNYADASLQNKFQITNNTTNVAGILMDSSGSVGIGTFAQDASAQLEVASSNKGFLPPRVILTNATTASPITLPATGLTVYHTGNAALPAGLYTNVGTPAAPNWAAGTASQDTTNDAWVNDSSNSMVKLGTLSDGTTARPAGTDMIVKDNGNVGIGNTNPIVKLDARFNPGNSSPGTGSIGLGETTAAASTAGAGALRYSTASGGVIQYSNGTNWNTVTSDVQKSTVVAKKTSSQTIAHNTGANVIDWVEIVDSNSDFNPATGFFTAPRDGNYSVSFSYAFTSSTVTAGSAVESQIIKNSGGTNTALKAVTGIPAGGTSVLGSSISFVVNMKAGDVINPSIYHITGSAKTLRVGTGSDDGFVNLSIAEL